MYKKMKYIIIFLFFMMGISDVNAQDLATNQMKMKILNMMKSATTIPYHDFAYKTLITQDENFSGDPLQGFATPGVTTNTIIFRHDKNDLIADLTITDPAFSDRTIWEGKIILDQINNKLKAIPRTQDEHYHISIKLIQPSFGEPTFEIDIVNI